MIIPYYKRYGDSSHLLAQQVGLVHGVKATHTGTLDPAAEGVLVILTGDDRYQKQKLADTVKVYEAEVLFGVSTDTHDVIGMPTNYQIPHSLNQKQIDTVLQTFIGTYSQTQPAFSAKRKNGTSYFELAKRGEPLETITNNIKVSEITTLSYSLKQLSELLTFQSSRLQQIKGDFRQADIQKKWASMAANLDLIPNAHFPVIKIKVVCSKRTYIRSLVRDLSKKMDIPAVLFSLIRTQNGPYSIKDCLCLI